MNLPILSAANLRRGVDYKVDKKNWTRRDFQNALFCQALEALPELYDLTHPGYKDVNDDHPSWRKLATQRKKIFADDEPNILTVPQLTGVITEMINAFYAAQKEAQDLYGSSFLPSALREMLKYGDQRCPYFSHLMFMWRVDLIEYGLSMSFPGPKLIRRQGVELIRHSNGSEEPISSMSAATRRALACEAQGIMEAAKQRGMTVRDRGEATKLIIEIRTLDELIQAVIKSG